MDSPLDRPWFRRSVGIAVVLALAAGLALLAVPMVVLYPFRSQTARGIALSFHATRTAALFFPIATVLSIAALVALWPATRSVLRRVALVLAVVLLGAGTWFARQRPFEWMFNPAQRVAFARVGEAAWLQPTDEVIAVDARHDAVAYPIAQLAYHHVVHDAIGGVRVVVTY